MQSPVLTSQPSYAKSGTDGGEQALSLGFITPFLAKALEPPPQGSGFEGSGSGFRVQGQIARQSAGPVLVQPHAAESNTISRMSGTSRTAAAVFALEFAV
eukprot:1479684-Rhodomonas_salina.4